MGVTLGPRIDGCYPGVVKGYRSNSDAGRFLSWVKRSAAIRTVTGANRRANDTASKGRPNRLYLRIAERDFHRLVRSSVGSQ